jgi:hypothetical protein
MDAWFSGSAQQAIVKQGNQYYLLTGEGPRKIREVNPEQAALLSKDWHDSYKLAVSSRARAGEELRRAIWCYDALLASSMSIDAQVNDTRREQAAIEADRLLHEDFASNHVLNAYAALPMPDSADLSGAKRICNRKNLLALGVIIKTVEVYQENIRAVRKAWEAIDVRSFGQLEQRAVFQTAAVRSGFFVTMVKRIGDTKRIEGLREAEKERKVTALPNSQRILNQWLGNADQYSAEPAQLVPAFTEEPVVTDTPIQGRAPMAHTQVSRSISAF